eukprot:scaffold6362_cov123-Isochrysis_galbana.AAC.7
MERWAPPQFFEVSSGCCGCGTSYVDLICGRVPICRAAARCAAAPWPPALGPRARLPSALAPVKHKKKCCY